MSELLGVRKSGSFICAAIQAVESKADQREKREGHCTPALSRAKPLPTPKAQVTRHLMTTLSALCGNYVPITPELEEWRSIGWSLCSENFPMQRKEAFGAGR